MSRPVILVLKAVLAILLSGLVGAQILTVIGTTKFDDANPPYAHLAVPFGVMLVTVLACAQAVLICIWALLTKVRADRIFSDSAFRWVDAILAAVGLATVLIATVLVLILTAGAGFPPLMVIVLAGSSVTGIGVALLVIVLRGLLRKASRLESDLAEVV